MAEEDRRFVKVANLARTASPSRTKSTPQATPRKAMDTGKGVQLALQNCIEKLVDSPLVAAPQGLGSTPRAEDNAQIDELVNHVMESVGSM